MPRCPRRGPQRRAIRCEAAAVFCTGELPCGPAISGRKTLTGLAYDEMVSARVARCKLHVRPHVRARPCAPGHPRLGSGPLEEHMPPTIGPLSRRVRTRRRRRSRWLVYALWAMGVMLAGALITLHFALRSATLEAHLRGELARLLNAPFDLGSLDVGLTSGVEVKDFRLYPSGSSLAAGGLAGPAPEPL